MLRAHRETTEVSKRDLTGASHYFPFFLSDRFAQDRERRVSD
jgi:hypothetical protein